MNIVKTLRFWQPIDSRELQLPSCPRSAATLEALDFYLKKRGPEPRVQQKRGNQRIAKQLQLLGMKSQDDEQSQRDHIHKGRHRNQSRLGTEV